MRGSSVLELSSAWVVFCLGLCGASCCGSSEMSHAIPRHVFQTLKSHRWNCNVLGCCTKFGYPNCVRVLVDEAPEASSCVRSSSHDTVHNPRDASNTTPTPQNAKSRIRSRCAQSNTMARSQIPLSPCASTSLDAHANPLTGAWASSSARGPAIPSLGNPTHVRNRRPTCRMRWCRAWQIRNES